MRLAYGQIRGVDKEILTNARQMGIDRVQFNLPYDCRQMVCGSMRTWRVLRTRATGTA